jgi:cytochrome bd-type quinol oxidase subunit 2
MTAGLLFKLVIFILLIAIFISLTGGLFFLAKDKGKSKRTMYSLTIRVALSVSLFILLLIGYMTGLIVPHGLMPEKPAAAGKPAPAATNR